MTLIEALQACPDCGVRPGRCHREGCDVERCSHCGRQRLGCASPKHDPAFSRWTGFWPGQAECLALGWVAVRNPEGPGWVSVPPGTPGAQADLNRFTREGLHRVFHIKPRVPRSRRA